MRAKDEKKMAAVFHATIKLVNRIGFAASSVSKIAREAGVSPATIYIYYKNKDDLLISTYLRIKKQLGEAMLRDLDTSQPLRDVFHIVWLRTVAFFRRHPDYIHYAEQFSNSPYIKQVAPEQVETAFEPMMALIKKGIDQKIIKDVDVRLISVFLYYSIYTLLNPRHCAGLTLSEEIVEQAFTMAWDAIKL